MIEGGDFKARVAYLDHNATAPIRPEAASALAETLEIGGNPSSVHAPGRAARRAVEDARAAVAALVGVRPAAVVFTASGTEANNQALRATGCDRAMVSAIEHDSVLKARGDALVAPVDPNGVIDLAALDALLARSGRLTLVSVMLANNETGAIQPVAEVAALAHRRGALVHCDAVQAAGRIAVDMDALGVDYLTLSGHKIGGAPGAGALIARDGAPLEALIRGGGQERGMRAGTENAPAIAAFGAAARLAREPRAELGAMRDGMEARLRAACPEAVVFSRDVARLPNTTQIAMPGVPSETQVIALDLDGVAVSAGSACSSGRVEPNRVLLAMGVAPELAACALRISLGWSTTAGDIDRLVAAWRALYERTRRRAA
jgi:cysteine desulfurase